MKKILFGSLSVFLLVCPVLRAEQDPLEDAHKSLKDEAFVVESDESDTSDSLNRISGNIDLGFSLPGQSYHSSNQYKPGPFAREESIDNSQNY